MFCIALFRRVLPKQRPYYTHLKILHIRNFLRDRGLTPEFSNCLIFQKVGSTPGDISFIWEKCHLEPHGSVVCDVEIVCP